MFRRSQFLASILVVLAACAAPPAPSEDEDEALATALSGGKDLESIAAASETEGDVEGVKFVPASETALQIGRPGEVNYVVIHDIEGAGRSAANTFRRSGNESSAHYIVDKKGVAIQMVREEDTANHAFHSVFNAYAIGIEHAGFAAENGYSREEYEESARIVASIVTRHRIPIDREHIIGHHQVPKTDTQVVACGATARDCGGQGGHADPGPNWDWNRYMSLIKQKAEAQGYRGADADEQRRRALAAVTPLRTLTPSKRLFGGYYATQCDDRDPEKQITYRIINKSGESPRLESRYVQARVGECGQRSNGLYPLIIRGFPVTSSPRDDLDLRGVTVGGCFDHEARVFRFEGASVPCERGKGSCRDPVLTLSKRGDGC